MTQQIAGRHRRHQIPEPRRTIYRYTFVAATAFNAIYGLAMMFAPRFSMRVAQYPVGQANPLALMLWQGVGLFVLIFAIGYWFASRDPERYAAFILVALVGKVLGIFGFLSAWLIEGILPGRVAFNVLFTDLIWLPVFVPFVWETMVKRRYEPR